MILCLDGGNTRLKWGVSDGKGWLARGALPWDGLAALAALPAAWPGVRRVMLAHVAGPERQAALLARLPGWQPLVHQVVATMAAGGVRNGYQEPARLGVDRWCALIGARALLLAETAEPPACLVVGAGTATTVDSLDGAGNFLGGLILPGLDMMRASLASGTAQLPLAEGRYENLPRNTQDAILSGCIEAQAGAIERAWRRLPAGALCLLAGGAAARLLPALEIPVRPVDDLVLEGLRRLALDAG